MQKLSTEEYLTIADTAQALRVSTVTVHRWIKQGRLPAYHVGPRKVLVRRADLTKVMTPVVQEEVTVIQEFEPSRIVIKPLTDEEVEQGRQALKQADALIAAIWSRSKRKPLGSSAEFLHEAREERTKQLLNL